MSNAVNKPYGMRPIRSGNGSPYMGEAQLYHIPSTDTNAYFIGRPVTLLGDGDVSGVPSVVVGVAGSAILGPVVGVHPVKPINPSLLGTSLSLEDTFIPATKTRDYYVMVADDPDLVYQVQQNESATLTSANIGQNANFLITSPSNNQQYDATVIQASSAAVTSTLNLRLLGTVQRDDNPIGASQFADWVAKINNHVFRGGTTGV